jgi:hypothetical protein
MPIGRAGSTEKWRQFQNRHAASIRPGSIRQSCGRPSQHQERMLLYHPILLASPWQAPDDLNKKIVKLLETSEPTLVARSKATNSTTNYDRDNAIKLLETLAHSIRQLLLRIYSLASHSFHVSLLELIPLASIDKSNLFTHIKGARAEHILNLRAHHGKTRSTSATALTKEQLKPHSAAHTLAFIEREYVEVDDDAEHFTSYGTLRSK